MTRRPLPQVAIRGLIGNGTIPFLLTINQGLKVNHRVWINFKELRKRLRFEDVLQHYKVEIRRRGPQHLGPCPLPTHPGSRLTPSFSANLDRGIFRCFSCKAQGNLLEFAGLMAGIDIKDGNALRKVAVELQSKFCPEGASRKTKSKPATLPTKPEAPKILVNAPLDFVLKDLDEKHPYLLGEGFSPETIHFFGLGFCSRGMLQGRVAIPLHDHTGKLVGFAGRAVDDSIVNEKNPRYLFPATREKDGVRLEFDLSLLLYNANRIEASAADVILVEGFPAVWWLHQCGFRNVVGLMEQGASEKHIEFVCSRLASVQRAWIMTHGDKDGASLAHLLLQRIAPMRFVRWVKLADGYTPIDLSEGEVSRCFRA